MTLLQKYLQHFYELKIKAMKQSKCWISKYKMIYFCKKCETLESSRTNTRIDTYHEKAGNDRLFHKWGRNKYSGEKCLKHILF